MSFAAFSPRAAYALIIAVAVSIWLLYLIKPRKPQVVLASTLLWRRALAATRTRDDRWRWLLSLLLALAIGLSLALALTRPYLRALGASLQRIVVILDNSASMAARTRDGRTRWQRALDGARQLMLDAGAGSEIAVLDTAGRAQLVGFLPPGQALEQLNSITLSSEASGRVPTLPVGATITHAYLFTDGVGVSAVPTGIVVRSVFEAADNVAITGFEARPVPGNPTRYEAFLQIENAAATPKLVTLEMIGATRFRVERQLQVAGAATVNLTLDVSDFEQGPLRAQIASQGDAFDLDNTAYCVVSPHRTRRVLLVTRGNGVLEDSLRVLPGIALDVRAPTELAPLPAADVYVFDGYAPRNPPAAGALLFRPPAAAWLNTKWQLVSRAIAASWDGSHPLSAGVSWRDLRLENALVAQPQAAASVVSASTAHSAGTAGALIVAGHARARWVAVGFALQDSNFHLQPGFPIFLGTVLSWLTEGPGVASEGLGRIEVPIADARVLEGGERSMATTATGRGTLFEAPRPGVYVVDSGRQQLIVVANAIDPRMAQINRQQIPTERVNPQLPDQFRRASPESWIWLLALAFVLLTVEWAAFSHRITK